MLFHTPFSNIIWNKATFRIHITRIRQVLMVLVFLVSLVGMSPVPARADSGGMVCETFDSLGTGSMIGTYAGWFDGGGGPVITSGVGVAGSVGLGNANNIFNWTANPFNWNASDFEKVRLQGDFQTNGSGQFDDDRLSWTINGTSTSSNNQFGVQLDPAGIVTYWSNVIGGSKVYDVIVPLSGLPSNAWYRFTVEITKLTTNSAQIDVSLVALDASGIPTGTPLTGSIADTSAMASDHTPAAGYFAPAVMYPSYKNYDSTAGAVDSTCFEIITRAPGPVITIAGSLFSAFSSDPGTPSAEQSYTVSGSNLTEDIIVTSPIDFEISTTSGNGFTTSLTLPQSGGEVSDIPIFVRFNRATSGLSSGDITHTSNGASMQSVAVSGTAAAPGNYALQFDGSNDHVAFGSAPGLNASAYTIEAWFYWTGGGTTTSTGTGGITAIPLITKGRGESESTGLNVNYFMGISGGKLAADFEALANGQNYPVAGTTTITTNVWHHAATTYNGTCWQLYLDGVAQTGGTTCPGVVPDNTSTQHAAIATAMTSSGAASGYYQGVMDEVRIWNVARTQSEIISTINSELTSGVGLIGRWGMNEGSGAVTTDSTVPAVAGTLINSPTWVAGAPFNITQPPLSEAVRVSQSSDDAEEEFGTGAMDLISTDLEIIKDGTMDQLVGLRFQNVEVPAGAVIHSAYIEFETDETTNLDPSSLTIYGQAADNPATFTTATSDISSRSKTTASVTWAPVAWSTVDGKHQTSDLSTIVQEIVNRGGWSNGNAMTFIVDGSGRRVAESYDGEVAAAPLLVIDYTEVAPTTPPDAPSDMAATIPQSNQVHLSWTDNANNESGFELERSTTGISGTYSQLTSLPANTKTHDDTSLVAGQEYCYQVRAVNIIGQSAYAGPVCATPTSPDALDFGASNAYVTFGDPDALDLAEFTIETWFKRTGPGTPNTTGGSGIPSAIPLVTHGSPQSDGSNLDANWILVIDDTNDVIAADFEDMASGLNHPVYGTTPITNDVWHHAAATYDGATWRLYLDGQLEASLLVNAEPRLDSIQQAGLGTMIESGGTPHGYFRGVLDEVRIWNYARAQAEIQSTINDEITVPETGLVARWALNDGGATVSGSAGTTVNGSVSGSGHSWVTPGAPFDLNFNGAPNQPTLAQPPDDSTDISTSPSLEVNVTDPESDQLEVTFYGRAVGEGIPEDFSVVVLPDTQNYSTSYPAIFTSQTQWIADHENDLNIVYVAHEGDIVNNAGATAEWDNADLAMDILDVSGIPYGILPGNHDTPTTFYNNYFGISRFAGKSFYGGYYGSNNDNNYTLFSAGGMDFIVINLQYQPGTAVLDWADARLKEYSDHRAIVVSHEMTGTGNPSSWQGQGLAIYNALSDNPNLFLMLCGHVHGEGQRIDTYNGNTVYTVLADYQNYASGGNGYLRIMEFSPDNDEIHVKTYSPYLNAFETDANSQFTLSYDMDGSGPFTDLGTTSVNSGATASVTWLGLSEDTEYEWYVEVSDGAKTTTGPTWSFTTVPPACYELTLGHAGDGSNPAATPSSSNGCSAGFYHAGEVITVDAATPDLGWYFESWYGTESAASSQLTMPASAHSAGANYAQNEYALILNFSGNGDVTKNPAKATYHYGELVQLTAVADPGWTFSTWSDGLTSTTNPNSLTITGDTTVTATFTQDEYTLAITTFGSGSISKNPNKSTYRYGESVELTPVAAAGWTFTGWNGSLSGSNNPATIVMNGDQNVTATFTQDVYTLAYTVIGNGNVTLDPTGGSYLSGTNVDLNAVADVGWTFGRWDGDVTGSSTTATILMNGNKNVTATFIESQYSLTVTTIGNGTVTSDVPPPYSYNDVVQLTANAADGWTFTGWSGNLSGSDNPASIMIDGDKTVTATFAQDEYTLTVTSEHGTVTKDPDRATYHYGDTVELLALADTGWAFGSWTGNVAGTDNPVTITIYGDSIVTANYTQDEYTLTINKSGNGTVTVEPDQVNYHYGDPVQLTAEADPGWTFSGWSGDLISTDNPAAIAMDGNKAITATFTQNVSTHSISLLAGWNLVSFNLHPVSTNISEVLASVEGNYDLVYAWDATGAHSGSGNWTKYDNIPLSPDTLTALDERMGFWIHMTTADTLDVEGSIPTTTAIAISNDAGGWNLVAYPSAANVLLPEGLSANGVGNDFSLVYAYHANDPADSWKLFDMAAPLWANDLAELSPGWGYWVKASADNVWSVDYAAP